MYNMVRRDFDGVTLDEKTKFMCETHMIEESLAGTSEGIKELGTYDLDVIKCSDCNQFAKYFR